MGTTCLCWASGLPKWASTRLGSFRKTASFIQNLSFQTADEVRRSPRKSPGPYSRTFLCVAADIFAGQDLPHVVSSVVAILLF